MKLDKLIWSELAADGRIAQLFKTGAGGYKLNMQWRMEHPNLRDTQLINPTKDFETLSEAIHTLAVILTIWRAGQTTDYEDAESALKRDKELTQRTRAKGNEK